MRLRRPVILVLAALVAALVLVTILAIVVLRERPPGPTPPVPTPTVSPSPGSAPGTVRLRVLSWNIHSATEGVGRVARDIAQGRPDVVLLQEVRSSSQGNVARELAMRLGMYWQFRPNTPLPRVGGLLGNAVLSRYPISQVSNTRLPWKPGTQRRGLMRTLIDVRGNHVTVYVTHLHFHGPIRMPQVRRVSALVGSPNCATVLGGDMNVTANTPMYAVLRSRLADSFDGMPREQKLTIPTEHPTARIDYLFHSAEVRTLWARVMPAAASDHRGVEAEFLVPASATC